LIPPALLGDDVILRMERATGLPLRLAYMALVAQVDRNGVFIPDPEWLESVVAPLDRWDWGDILDCMDAMGYIGWFTISDGKKYGAIVGWKRMQTPHRTEKAVHPQPLWTNRALVPVFCDPARWVRRRPPPHGFTEDDLAALRDAAGRQVPLDETAGLDLLWELTQQGTPLAAFLGAMRKWCPSLSSVMRTWADPWLISMARREVVLMQREAVSTAKDLYAEHDELLKS
jgi:hypothetical protein